MRRILTAALTAVLWVPSLPVPEIPFHPVEAKCSDPEPDRCERVQEEIHRIWDEAEHKAIEVFACESGLYKNSRRWDDSTQYKGIVSAGSGFRDSYPVWSWDIPDQIRAAWQAYKDSGFQQWGEGEPWGCA